MNKRINLNDPTAWSEFDWSDPIVPEVLKKTDGQVARSRAARLNHANPEVKAKHKEATKTALNEPNTKQKHQDGIKKAISSRSENQDWVDNVRKANKKTTATNEWKEAHANGVKNRRPETEDEKQVRLAKRDANLNWHQNQTKAMQNLAQDPIWIENHKKVIEKTKKKIQTPYGIFDSRQSAIDHLTSIGISNARGKIVDWLKSKPNEFFYIKSNK